MDLCTLQQVKTYLGLSDSNSDTVLQYLIDTLSVKAATYCGVNFDSQAYTEYRNGSGNYRMVLRNGPVSSIASIAVGSVTIPAAGNANVEASGWRNVDLSKVGDGRQIILNGYQFCKGYGNVVFSYTAGYAPTAVTNEPVNVPATPGPYTTTLLGSQSLLSITSLKYTSSGTALVQVAANPVAGQYTLSGGTLGFSSADQGAALLCTYTTLNIPGDLNEAMVELVSLRFRSKEWTGYSSKSLAGETVAFLTQDLPPTIKGTFDAYKAPVIPI